MSDVLIDLGELPRAGRARPHPAGRLRSRTVLAAATAVLLGSLAGAAPAAPPKPPVLVPAGADAALFVDADRFFLVDAHTVRAYGLPFGEPLSVTPLAVPGTILGVAAAGRTVLVSAQAEAAGPEVTVALAEGTGRELWRDPARLVAVSMADRTALLRDNNARPGPLDWYGVDLGTGEIRWQLTQPAQGYIAEAAVVRGFPRRLVTVDGTGALTVRDAVSGVVLAATRITPPADWARRGVALWPDGDLVLLGDHQATSAYALADLTLRWQTPADLYAAYVGPDCGDAVCLLSPRGGGILVIDRVTGRGRWSSDRWSNAVPVGPYLLAGDGAAAGGNRRLDVLDAGTGRVRGQLGRWQQIGPPRPDGTVVVLRRDPVADTVRYARIDPARLTVRDLGTADHVAGDCPPVSDVLVCRRTDGTVGIWRLTGQ